MNPKMISLGLAAGLIYLAYAGKIKNDVAKIAAVAIGAGVIARNTPAVNQYL